MCDVLNVYVNNKQISSCFVPNVHDERWNSVSLGVFVVSFKVLNVFYPSMCLEYYVERAVHSVYRMPVTVKFVVFSLGIRRHFGAEEGLGSFFRFYEQMSQEINT